MGLRPRPRLPAYPACLGWSCRPGALPRPPRGLPRTPFARPPGPSRLTRRCRPGSLPQTAAGSAPDRADINPRPCRLRPRTLAGSSWWGFAPSSVGLRPCAPRGALPQTRAALCPSPRRRSTPAPHSGLCPSPRRGIPLHPGATPARPSPHPCRHPPSPVPAPSPSALRGRWGPWGRQPPGRGGRVPGHSRAGSGGGAVTLEAWQSSMYPKSSSPSPRPWSRSRPFWTSTS